MLILLSEAILRTSVRLNDLFCSALVKREMVITASTKQLAFICIFTVLQVVRDRFLEMLSNDTH